MSLTRIAGAPVIQAGNSPPDSTAGNGARREPSSSRIARPNGLLTALKDGQAAPNRGVEGARRMRANVPSGTSNPPASADTAQLRPKAERDFIAAPTTASSGDIASRPTKSAENRGALRLRNCAQSADTQAHGRLESLRSLASLPSPKPSIDAGARDMAEAGSDRADTRSNKAVIDAYRSGKRSELEVQKVTASLLKRGGSFATNMRLFNALKDAGIRPSLITYNAAISACGKAGRSEEALALIAELQQLGERDPSMRMDLFTYNAAISACGNAGQPDQALALFDELKQRAGKHPALRPSIVSYGAAISACAKAGRAREALALLQELESIGAHDPAMRPNEIVYNAAISACAKAGLADEALALLHEVKTRAARGEPVRLNAITYNSAIYACGKAGRADDALRLLEELERLALADSSISVDLITYNSAIFACANGGRRDGALALLDKLRGLGERDSSMRPTVTTYNAAIGACEKAGRADDALALLNELKELARRDASMRPSVASYSAVIAASGKAGRVDQAMALLTELIDMAACDPSIRPDIAAFNAAIVACGKGGRPQQAHELLKTAKRLGTNGAPTRPNATSYSAVISAYASAGDSEQAHRLIDEAIANGVFAPHAGYDVSANALDFHEDRVCANPPKSERPRGIASTLAVALLRYHTAAGNLNRRTTFIVGQHGDNAVKHAVLAELNRYWPESYAVSARNPGVVAPVPAAFAGSIGISPHDAEIAA